MKTYKNFEILSISKSFAGYGHSTISCTFSDDNGTHSHNVTTSNTMLTDRMNDDDSEIEDAARQEAAEMVIDNWVERNS